MLTVEIRNTSALLDTGSSPSLRLRGEIALPETPATLDEITLRVVIRNQAGRILKADHTYIRVPARRDRIIPFDEGFYVEGEFENLEYEMHAEVKVVAVSEPAKGSVGEDDPGTHRRAKAKTDPDLGDRETKTTEKRAVLTHADTGRGRVQPTPARSLRPGNQLGRYIVRLKVCDWEHGAVYVGDHRSLSKTVLIKVADNEGPGRDILAAEAQRMVNKFTQHVAVDDLGSERDLSYLLVSVGIADLIHKATNSDLLESLATEPISRMLDVSLANARALVAAALSPWRPG
jgi:hypothetical protein